MPASVSPDPDVARASQIVDVVRAHPGERVVAFSEYTETVLSLFRRLMPTCRVAMLTHGVRDLRDFYINDLRFLRQFDEDLV